MKNNKSVGVNAVLNVIRQGLSVIIPLVTYPYALRVLGTEEIGKVNFGQSIVSYFALLATLGTTSYIVREGARRKNNKKDLETIASQIYTINVCLTFLAFILLVIFLTIVPKVRDYKWLIILQSASIFFTCFGIDWINTIYEDFTRITIRSIITYVISFVLLFVLVKNEKDTYWYALLTVITTAVICISNRIYFRKIIKIKIVRKTEIKTHFLPLLKLFANTVAVTINTNFDITMLGWIKGDYDVGIYSLSVKIYSVIRNLIVAVYNVAIPRLSYYLGIEKKEEYKDLSTKICSCLILFVVPSSIGICSYASKITVIVGGKDDFKKAVFSLCCLSVALIFTTLSGLLMNAMNISLRRDKDNLIATSLGCLLNVLLNLFFIPLWGYDGAAITTFLSEFFILAFLFVRFKDIKEYICVKKIKKTFIHAFLGSTVIAGYAVAINYFISNSMLSVFIGALGSIIIYFSVLFAFKDEIIIMLARNLKKRFLRKT